MEDLLSALNGEHAIPGDLQKDIASRLKHATFEKGQYLLKEGEISKHICYIPSGLVRTFSGDEETGPCSWFLTKGDIAFGLESFFDQKPCDSSMQAVTKTEILYMSYEDYMELKKKYIDFVHLENKILLRYYRLNRLHLSLIQEKSAKARHKKFVALYPHLLAIVPDKEMCKFYGISKSTFSRIKNELARGNRKGKDKGKGK